MLPLSHHAWLSQDLTDLERADIISPSTSSFTIPVIIVPQKKNSPTNDISYRTVVDFRKISEQLEYWSFPLKRSDTIFSKLYGAKFFSTLDITYGYYSIIVIKDGRKCTIFNTECGNYKFL